MDIQNVNAMQDYELAKVSPSLVVGVSLDKKNGRRLSITIRDSRLEKAEWIGDHRLQVKAEDYIHGRVIIEADRSALIDPLPYTPAPYPKDVILSGEVWFHPDGKYWTPYASKSDPSMVAYANEITKHRLVFSQVKSSISVSERIQEKEKKGYSFLSAKQLKDLM